ncbi:GntR family transcriptional regulator [Verticiella sediminum]|uniref:GntR family transcriptional regulator n=1 Tax=Verticiella sediminum TaxID=1247510 RepID=A0A556B1H2_9BURK|nr:GntR family transcriptional regulator [Verticiella sediminum]TSH99020.1 GntR family transcriptional regulator [Verticiella sediminum]
MSSHIERVTTELRRRVLAGELRAGERIREVHASEELGVSRTPLRLALSQLAAEGLLERLPTRGFRVRHFTLEDVTMAIDVRGTLEGMAVRLIAEAGVTPVLVRELEACVQEGRQLLEGASHDEAGLDAGRWAAMNVRFHDALIQGAGNPALGAAVAAVAKNPMAGAGALGVSGVQPLVELAFVQRAQFDHEDVLKALVQGEGSRAEALMREHARRSRDNKRAIIEGMHRARAGAGA